MVLITKDELHEYIKEAIIDSLVDGSVVYTDHRRRADGTEYDCCSLDMPMSESAERLRRRADLYDFTKHAEVSSLSDYTRRLCDILCDVTGRLYFAWYPSGVFAGRYYHAYLSESAIDDVTIQDSAYTRNIAPMAAAAQYYNPTAGDSSPTLQPLTVRYVGDFFEDTARHAVVLDEPILAFKCARAVTNL